MNELKTQLSYRGMVTLSLNVSGKTITISKHNSSLPYLHKILCQFLTGNFPGNSAIPRYVMLKRNGELFLNSKQPLTAPNYAAIGTGDSATWYASFTATINYANMISAVDASDSATYELYMLSDNSDEIAFIEIDAADLSKISPGTNLIIDWRMMFKDEEEN